jgi:hypothetical protein
MMLFWWRMRKPWEKWIQGKLRAPWRYVLPVGLTLAKVSLQGSTDFLCRSSRSLWTPLVSFHSTGMGATFSSWPSIPTKELLKEKEIPSSLVFLFPWGFSVSFPSCGPHLLYREHLPISKADKQPGGLSAFLSMYKMTSTVADLECFSLFLSHWDFCL